MKKENLLWGAVILFTVSAIIAYFLIEKQKRRNELNASEERERRLEHENDTLRNIVMDLKKEVNSIIDNKDELPQEIKNQLKSLIQKYKDIDEKVTTELLSVTALIEINENTKAVMGLAKIIENLLKKIYAGDCELKTNPKFIDLIEHAKNKQLIEKEEYHFLNGVREVRNEEAHKLAVKKEINIISTSLLTGFSIIFKLASRMEGALK